ncbi:FMN-binding protein [Actinokineospora sp. NBRC 105648]|uniref:FMN-binding protein n=1 Tax=Actinokineospora sp. NBRC 105648 TaxID=3032206 RepID=UPI0024A209A8|nr:FMN-binding protein [Actinokineospora sp. NBRC 105648]GLZ40281.1 FMN-binding protein [Actinokineospora sp. NBRC 105648]
MRRIVLWALSTMTVVVLLFGYHTSTSGAQSSAKSAEVRQTTGSGTTAGGDTVTGDAADTRWGPVQVRLTVSSGQITAVDVVEYPDSNGKDKQINARALPILVQETLEAQSADIDMVSGATVTSDGYLQSLQSALDGAGL